MGKSSLLVSMVVAVSLVFTVSCVSKEVPVAETYYETEYRTEEYAGIEEVVTIVEGEDKLEPELAWWNSLMYWSTYPGEERYSSESYIWYSGYYLPEHKAARIQFNTRPKVIQVRAFNVSDVDHIDSPQDVSTTGLPSVFWGHAPDWPWWKYPQGWKRPPGLDWPPLSLSTYLDFFNLILNSDRQIYTSYLNKSSGNNSHDFDISGVTKLALVVEMGGFSGAYVTDPTSSVKLIWSDELVEEKTVTKQRQVPYEVEKQRTVMQTKQVPFWEAIFGE